MDEERSRPRRTTRRGLDPCPSAGGDGRWRSAPLHGPAPAPQDGPGLSLSVYAMEPQRNSCAATFSIKAPNTNSSAITIPAAQGSRVPKALRSIAVTGAVSGRNVNT
jgi:hypothetical protein